MNELMPISIASLKHRHYFSPENIEDAKQFIKDVRKTAKSTGVPVIQETDMLDSHPAGYGILVQPVLERNKEKRGTSLLLSGIVIASVPDLDAVTKENKGKTFLQEALSEAYGRKLRTIALNADKTGAKAVFPKDIEGYITEQSETPTLTAFNVIAPHFIKLLHAYGNELRYITPPLLRVALSSSAKAAIQYPRIADNVWDKLLAKMTRYAIDKGHDPAILRHWIATRKEASDMSDSLPIDIDALG